MMKLYTLFMLILSMAVTQIDGNEADAILVEFDFVKPEHFEENDNRVLTALQVLMASDISKFCVDSKDDCSVSSSFSAFTANHIKIVPGYPKLKDCLIGDSELKFYLEIPAGLRKVSDQETLPKKALADIARKHQLEWSKVCRDNSEVMDSGAFRISRIDGDLILKAKDLTMDIIIIGAVTAGLVALIVINVLLECKFAPNKEEEKEEAREQDAAIAVDTNAAGKYYMATRGSSISPIADTKKERKSSQEPEQMFSQSLLDFDPNDLKKVE